MATISTLTNLPLASLDGTEEFWVQKNGLDYRLDITDLRNYCGGIQYTSLSIASASILTLNATPLTIVSAPGAGYAIQAIAGSYKLTFNSVAYATNTRLELITSGASIAQLQSSSNSLAATVTQHGQIINAVNVAAGNTQILENAALQVKVSTGNPTAGNSNMVVYLAYRIITI